jgi:hypothetical protein
MTLYAPNLGDIGMVAMEGNVGRGIQIGQWLNGDGWSQVQHVFTYVGQGHIVEAMPGGALLTDLFGRFSRYAPTEIVWLRCPPEFGEAVAAAARQLGPHMDPNRDWNVVPGVPYSFLDYGALALHRFHIPTPHLRAYIENSGHLICSQLSDLAANRGGWHIFDDGRWEGDVTPNDLYHMYLAQERARLAG